MVIGETQCLFFLLLIAATVGFVRGWQREVITAAILLGVVLFLVVGGNSIIWNFLFVGLPNLVQGPAAAGAATQAASTSPMNPYVSLLEFTGLTSVGYVVGHRYGAPAKTSQHRLTGTLAGLTNGSVVTFFLSRNILPETTVDFTSPSTSLATSYLITFFGLGLIALLLVVLVRH
ncbi:MAG: hypothetical protein ABI068_13660 [Ktedonobacterales bacterium]